MAKRTAETHESLTRVDEIAGPSDRSFGLTFAAVFAILAALSLWRDGSWWPYLTAVALIFAVIAMLRAALLAPLNRLWFKFGLLLHKVMTPLIMGLMFFGAFTPMAWLLKIMGKDLLRLKRRPDADTYWISREPPGPKPETMADQF